MSAPAGASRTAELLLVDADVITLDPARPRASAVAVADGRVVAVGGDADVRPWRGSRTQVVPLGGAALTPGWVDGHSHPVGGLSMAAGTDLTGVHDLDSLREVLAATARRPVGGWVQGWGLDPGVFPDGTPQAHLVDDVLGGVPALLRFFDCHSALASSRALGLAGVDGPRESAQRSSVVCDADGRPTGHLLEQAAMELVERCAPAPPRAERLARLRALLADMAATGLTGAHVMDGDDASLALLEAAEDEVDLPLHLRVAPFCLPGVDGDALAHLVALQGRAGRSWEVAGVKLMIDGTIDGGTAWLEHPDRDGAGTHPFWKDPRAYAAAVRRLARAGVPTTTHAIGDAGVRFVLDVLDGLPLGAGGVAHRLEHLETLPDDLVKRIAAQGVTASVQPTHCTRFVAADGSDNWSQRLGDERVGRAWRTRDLWDAGATVVLGSDWPVAPFDPRSIMADARLRRPVDDPEAVPVLADQALTAERALHGFTTRPARAVGKDGDGRVAVGARADLTALAVDPLRAGPDEVAAADVPLTVVGGRLVGR